MDSVAVSALLPAEVPGLYRFARTLAPDRQHAEDLVQDTVIRALERAETFRQDSSLATWLRRILHNLAVDQARRRREVPVDDLVAEVEARWNDDAYTVDAATVVARAETREELSDALIRLPVIYRAAVVLHDAEGLTAREIAEVQGIALPAAKQRLRRGRMMLVDELARGAHRREALKGIPLRCGDARARVGDYLDGEVDEPTARALEQHLRDCPTCPPLVAGLVGTTTALRRSGGVLRDPDSVLPPELAARVAALLESARGGLAG
ncbi:MAG TPA: sigma-70 family RNA polymerase sigma factor [Kineosporiaceae bacterium]|nr:sigma-70 family RNA polymerase sigma factor [Kineosporiaceae bacterium]